MARTRRVLQPLVVHGEALHQVLGEVRRGPLPELRAPMAANPEADGEDRIEVVVAQAALDLTLALETNL
jgi:hypothetical protein